MTKLIAFVFAVMFAWVLPSPVVADDPAEVLQDLLAELTERQDEPLAAVLAELRARCEAGDEPACAVTALRPFLLGQRPEDAE